jgi:hypothetical protein
MRSYFTKDLEWYEDNGGLLNYETVLAKFQAIFNKRNKISIELIKENSWKYIPSKIMVP